MYTIARPYTIVSINLHKRMKQSHVLVNKLSLGIRIKLLIARAE